MEMTMKMNFTRYSSVNFISYFVNLCGKSVRDEFNFDPAQYDIHVTSGIC